MPAAPLVGTAGQRQLAYFEREPLAAGRLVVPERLVRDDVRRADVERDAPFRAVVVLRAAVVLRALVVLRAPVVLRPVVLRDAVVLRVVPLRLFVRRRLVFRRPPLRWEAGISAFATDWVSFGISFSRNPAMRFSSRRIAFASCSVSRSPTVFASVSIAE